MREKRLLRTMVPARLVTCLKSWENKVYVKRMLDRRVDGFEHGKYPLGVNLIGDIRAETGLGQSMRILAHILDKSGLPYSVMQIETFKGIEDSDRSWTKNVMDDAPYAVNLLHINPDNFARIYASLRDNVIGGRYNIAYWLWELEDFPDKWLPCIEVVDEIWTPSEFISRGLRRKTKKPVTTVPYGIEILDIKGYNKEYFGLPEDKFLFLMMYDSLSISERKNPYAVIRAFKKAFTQRDKRVGLVIKVNHMTDDDPELTFLKEQLEGYEFVYILTGSYTRAETYALIEVCDVLVSLHRSEGFGLSLAEAMYLGKPVIGTDWSATSEFMNEKNSCPVKYRLVKINKDIGPYLKGNNWADADVAEAAGYMAKLLEDKKFYAEIAKNAKNYIKGNLSMDNAARKITDRIEAIDNEKNSAG